MDLSYKLILNGNMQDFTGGITKDAGIDVMGPGTTFMMEVDKNLIGIQT